MPILGWIKQAMTIRVSTSFRKAVIQFHCVLHRDEIMGSRGQSGIGDQTIPVELVIIQLEIEDALALLCELFFLRILLLRRERACGSGRVVREHAPQTKRVDVVAATGIGDDGQDGLLWDAGGHFSLSLGGGGGGDDMGVEKRERRRIGKKKRHDEKRLLIQGDSSLKKDSLAPTTSFG